MFDFNPQKQSVFDRPLPFGLSKRTSCNLFNTTRGRKIRKYGVTMGNQPQDHLFFETTARLVRPWPSPKTTEFRWIRFKRIATWREQPPPGPSNYPKKTRVLAEILGMNISCLKEIGGFRRGFQSQDPFCSAGPGDLRSAHLVERTQREKTFFFRREM